MLFDPSSRAAHALRSRRSGRLVVALMTVGLALAGTAAVAADGNAAAPKPPAPVAAPRSPMKPAATAAAKPRVSPYAVWRRQNEDAKRAAKPDASGHGERVARPEGQVRPHKLPH